MTRQRVERRATDRLFVLAGESDTLWATAVSAEFDMGVKSYTHDEIVIFPDAASADRAARFFNARYEGANLHVREIKITLKARAANTTPPSRSRGKRPRRAARR